MAWAHPDWFLSLVRRQGYVFDFMAIYLISAGVMCSCFEGFRLTDDNKTCQDINECEDPSSCSQHCFNNRGSFWCKCVEGYKLESDVTRCKAAGKRKSRENRRLYYLVPALPVPEVWDSTSKNTHSTKICVVSLIG